MADKWYVIRGTMRLGPLGFPELQNLVAGGKLTPADVVQGVGGGPPQPAGTVPGLFPQAAPAPAPMPTHSPAYPGPAPHGGSGAMPAIEPRWFVQRGGQDQGPFASADLVQFAAQGVLTPQCMVRREDQAGYVEARQIPGLFPNAPPPPSFGKAGGTLDQAVQSFTRTMQDLKQPFGEAIGNAFANAQAALGALMTRPFALTFCTLVFLISSFLATSLIVTAPLVPMFLMGYVTILRQSLDRNPVNLQCFLNFARHGWDALWHLLMLAAAFMVLVSALSAPFLIGGALLYSVGGGGTTLVLALAAQSESASSTPGSASRPQSPTGSTTTRTEFRPPDWMARGFATIMQNIYLLATIGVAVLLSTPVHAAMILYYLLVYRIAQAPMPEPGDAKRFDLVYDAFGKAIRVGRRHWKELSACGLMISVLMVGGPWLLMWLVSFMGLFMTGWFTVFIMPLFLFFMVVYVQVFMAVVCMEMSKIADRLGEN